QRPPNVCFAGSYLNVILINGRLREGETIIVPGVEGPITQQVVVVSAVGRYAVILAFDVKVERESQEMADSLGVRIFSAEIIYHLFDAFTKYREDYKKSKQDEFK
ncbi:hypothetical protein XENOCAPTIV_023733, partial [Xenoophorus captivus]